MQKIVRKAMEILLSHVGVRITKHPQCLYRTLSPFDLAMIVLQNSPLAKRRFIQVGANDGIYGDHLRRYVASGIWEGVLIEPQPDVFERLRSNLVHHSAQLHFENIAIGTSGEYMTLYRAPGGPGVITEYASTVTSANKKVVARQLGLNTGALESLNVPCQSLDEIVKKYRYSDFSVLMIDCEGADYDVLRSLSLEMTAPLVVQFEHGHLRASEVTRAVDYLASNGYRVCYGGAQNDTVAVHKSFWAVAATDLDYSDF